MHDDIDFRALCRLVGAGALVLATLAGGASALLWYWDDGNVQHAVEPPERWAPVPRPEVRSQNAMQRYLEDKDAGLRGYAWIDEAAGLARIPLDAAMQALAAQPVRPGAVPFPALDAPPLTPAMAQRAGRPTWEPGTPTPIAEPAAQPQPQPPPPPPPPANRGAPPSPQPQAYIQRPGAQLDMEAVYTQADGAVATLPALMRGQAAILVLGYYHCPMLCSTLMDGVLESVRDLPLPAPIIAISIDPAEGPADARRKQDAYASTLQPAAAQRLHLLTATPERIASLTRTVGFPYRYDPETQQYGHPAGFIILTPQGQASRYVGGVRFDPRDIRLALVEASQGSLGSITDQILLYCSHYDPQRGTYNVAVMRIARAVGAVSIVLLAALVIWRTKTRRARP